LNKPSSHDISRISALAKRAARAQNWAAVGDCAREILKHDKRSPEGWFLTGLLENAAGQYQKAVAAFSQSIQFDAKRYDAAVELAKLCLVFLRHREAVALLKRYESMLDKNPYYLDMAADIYTRLGLHAKAWPLYRKANEQQPDIDRLQANLAACAVHVGQIRPARSLYHSLLARHPSHHEYHYELSRLARAQDSSHVDRMKEVLDGSSLPPEKNIFLYHAIAKELEDLEQWQKSFRYYKLAADTAASFSSSASYDCGSAIDLIDKIIDVCNSDWLEAGIQKTESEYAHNTPIFMVGLPGTETNPIGLIVASHSKVESAGGTPFLQTVIQKLGGAGSLENTTPAVIEAAAKKDSGLVAKAYLGAVGYKLRGRPMFIDECPGNFMYLGFIAKAFPGARIVHLRRNPMDACLAMYKQPFSRQAHTLEDLGPYYLAYDRLRQHWRETLGDRVIEVEFESLVAESEAQTRTLLDRLGLEFEPSCLDFHRQGNSIAAPDEAQAPEKTAFRSVNYWKNWTSELQPLLDYLEKSGISIA